MQIPSSIQIFSAFTLTCLSSGIFVTSTLAEENTFFCGTYNGTAATLANTDSGEVAVVLWDAEDLGTSTLTSQERCQQTSDAFQTAYSQGELNYLTTGRMDGELIACVAELLDGPCTTPLFTLSSQRSPKVTLQRVLGIRIPSSDPSPFIYVELDRYLTGGYNSTRISENTANNSSFSSQDTSFICGTTAEGVPATLARNESGEVPVVLWTAEMVGNSGASPEELCEQVSAKFETYYRNGELSYITTGRMNGELVACIADREGGDCQESLFALATERKPRAALQRSFQIRVPSTGPIGETGTPVYIDLERLLNGGYPSSNGQ